MAAMRNLLASFALATLLAGCGSNPPDTPGKPGPAETPPAVTWVEKEIEHAGNTISLGVRAEPKSTSSLEPVVAITRDGKPVDNAMVFDRLVSADDGQPRGDEVATVYEPAAGSEPALYAQGKLAWPEAGKCKVRFRIVLPNVDEDWQRDVELPLK